MHGLQHLLHRQGGNSDKNHIPGVQLGGHGFHRQIKAVGKARGQDFFAGTEDPKLHERALNAQRGVLAHVLHPVVMERITDTRLYGNEYPLAEVLTDLTDAVFAADRATNINTFRQNLQVEYVNRLARIIADEDANPYDFVSRGLALANLQRIDQMMAGKTGNAETRAHAAHLRHIIRQAVDAD